MLSQEERTIFKEQMEETSANLERFADDLHGLVLALKGKDVELQKTVLRMELEIRYVITLAYTIIE